MTYDGFWLEDHPFWSYEDAIRTVRDEYPQAWADFWGISDSHAPEHLDPDLWEEARHLHSVAQRLVRAAGELSRTKLPEDTRTLPKLLEMEAASERKTRRELLESLRTQVAPEALESPEWRQIERFLRWEDGEAGNKERLFSTAVEIHAFGLWGCSPGELARRSLELLDFLVRVKGVRAREYLRRVSNCYIRGMRPELAVMARSVLESALEDLEIDAKVEEIRKLRGKRYDTLADWIEAASSEKALDEVGRIAAEEVKRAGDDAMHVEANLVPEETAILANLRLVLEQLEAFPRPVS